MIEVFKCSINPSDMYIEQETLDAKHFEIQLIDKDRIIDPNTIQKFSRCITAANDIVSVHTILSKTSEPRSCDIATIYLKETRLMLENACVLADMASKNYCHKVGVVIHNSLTFKQYNSWLYYNSYVKSILAELFEKYPGVELWIENITPIDINDNDITFCNGVLKDSALIAADLNKYFKGRVFSVFDFCHALITSRMIKTITGRDMLDDLFIAFKDTCKEIHFANAIEYSMLENQHGVGFSESNADDVALVKYFLNMYNKYLSSAYLCYEINEKDYTKRIRTEQTQELVHKILSEYETVN